MRNGLLQPDEAPAVLTIGVQHASKNSLTLGGKALAQKNGSQGKKTQNLSSSEPKFPRTLGENIRMGSNMENMHLVGGQETNGNQKSTTIMVHPAYLVTDTLSRSHAHAISFVHSVCHQQWIQGKGKWQKGNFG